MTTVGEATDTGDIETIGSTGVSRRIYAYTLPGKDSLRTLTMMRRSEG